MIGRTLAALLVAAAGAAPTLRAQEAPACMTGRVAVTGRVMDLLTLRPVPGASVSAFTVEGGFAGSVTADEEGIYLLCAVSGVDTLHLRALLGEVDAPEVAVHPGQAGIERDLYLRVTEPGTVRGTVVDRPSGEPVEGLVVTLEGTRRTALTGADGGFRIPNVPAGDHRVRLEHVAYGARTDTLAVAPGEEVEVRIEVAPQAVALDPLVVVARRPPSEAERVGIRFDGLRRAEIDSLVARTRSFPALLQNAGVPGLTVRETYQAGRGSAPALCIETGRRRGRNRIGDIGCYMVEVYIDGLRVPSPETRLPLLDPNAIDSLQVLPPVWAIGRYSGPRVHNGVLVIYTKRR